MVAEIVCVGTEILMGNIVNTNAQVMAEGLAEAGISSFYQVVVGDNPGRMEEAFKTALGRADIVLVNGGLGPTPDDLTTEIAARVFGKRLFEDAEVKEHILSLTRAFIASNPNARFTGNNLKMALVPEGASLFRNANGQAPGILMEEEGKRMILLPGPPNEFIPMFRDEVMPYLRRLHGGVLLSKTLKIIGIGESMVADRIGGLIEAQTNPTVATYAKIGEVHVRVTASGADEAEAERTLAPMCEELYRRFGEAIFTDDADVTLEEAIVRLMAERGLTLSTAESCTGGMVASRIVNVAGASDVLISGHVTYANSAKEKYLGVKAETLADFGAVSEECAQEMAEGGVSHTGSDYCVITTGIAGPGGGTPEKPVGLVYIAVSGEGRTKVQKLMLRGGRMTVRTRAAQHALTLLYKMLTEKE